MFSIQQFYDFHKFFYDVSMIWYQRIVLFMESDDRYNLAEIGVSSQIFQNWTAREELFAYNVFQFLILFFSLKQFFVHSYFLHAEFKQPLEVPLSSYKVLIF